MKKIVFLLLMMAVFLMNVTMVYAVCDATQTNTLTRLASNVSRSYEIVIKEVPKDQTTDNPPDELTLEEYENYVFKYKYFRIHIANITEELYVVVTNNANNEKETFYYDDTDNGAVYFDKLVGTYIINYKIEIYSSDVTNCPDQLLTTLYLQTPKYNSASESMLCEGIEEYYLCHEYLSVDVDFTNFLENVDEYRNSHVREDVEEEELDEKENKGFIDFIQEHIIAVVAIGVVVIFVGGLTTFVVIKKRRKRIL